MPIYEYRCTACQHKLETLQKFSDAPLVTCPACGKEALTKLVSAAGFQLKGSGWYQTDFRGGGGAKKPETAEKATGGSEKARRGDRRPGQDRDVDRARLNRRPRRPRRRRRPPAPDVKRYLVAGLLVWVPLGITIWVLHFLVTTLDQTLLLFPEGARPDALLGMHIPGFGVLLSFAILLCHRRRSPPTSSARGSSASGSRCSAASRS